MKKITLLFLLSGFIFTASASKNFVTFKSPQKIDSILDAIPAREFNLAAVMRSYNIKVDSIQFSEPDASDINDGSFLNKKADKFIDINLKDPVPTNSECPIIGALSFTLRKGKYLPETRTGNFLVNRICEAPDR
jgi:hypothetical protein